MAVGTAMPSKRAGAVADDCGIIKLQLRRSACMAIKGSLAHAHQGPIDDTVAFLARRNIVETAE